ncbi:hypothetical protein Angca_001422, partial [Angiostrongylus cantonensis]
AAAVTAINAAYYNTPIVTWGLSVSHILSDMSTYPTVAVLSGTSYSLGIAIKSVMMSFGWKQFAFVYSNRKDDLKCSIMKNDLQVCF